MDEMFPIAVDRGSVIPPWAWIIFSLIGIAFLASCVWLIVRIVNRRERWAKWTLAATLALPVLYVGSFGPTCWAYSRAADEGDCEAPNFIYAPILLVWRNGGFTAEVIIRWYANLWASTETEVTVGWPSYGDDAQRRTSLMRFDR